MNKFQYEIYNKQIESLKGTKKPLKDIINKLFVESRNFFKSTSYTTEEYAFFITLVLKAVEFSSLYSPLTEEQRSNLEYGFRNIVADGSLTKEQIILLFKYSTFTVNLYPSTLAEYRTFMNYKKELSIINKDNNMFIGKNSIDMFHGTNITRVLAPIDAEFYKPQFIDCFNAKQDIAALEQSIADLTELKDKLNEYISTDE